MPHHVHELARAAHQRKQGTPVPESVNQARAIENPIVALQRVIGNHGMQQLLQRTEDADLDASDGTLVFPEDHIDVDGGSDTYENQGPPSPDPGVDTDASDGTLVFPEDHIDVDGGGTGGDTYENQGPPSPDPDVDMDASDGTLVFPEEHVDVDGGGGGDTYENQGPPSPDPDVDMDASDGTLVFPEEHIDVDGGGTGGDNSAGSSFSDWF